MAKVIQATAYILGLIAIVVSLSVIALSLITFGEGNVLRLYFVPYYGLALQAVFGVILCVFGGRLVVNPVVYKLTGYAAILYLGCIGWFHVAPMIFRLFR